MTLRDRIAESLGRVPQADPERCVHARAAVASCRRCVDACPTDAWTLDDDALGIDTDRCDGCGLCVAHCPEGALSLAGLSADLHRGLHRLRLTCTRATALHDAWSLPCVNALGMRDISELYQRGLRRLALHTGDCANCPRADEQGLLRRIAMLNRVLRQRGQATIAIDPDDAVGMPAESDAQTPEPQLNRRGFLHRMLGTLSEPVAEPTTATSSVPDGWVRLAQTGDLALFAPGIDSARCNGCDACVRICPHGALSLAADAYRIAADACTGCGLCIDVCDRHAVTVGECAPLATTQVALESGRCKACGAQFHEPRIAQEKREMCQVCYRVNHRRNLFQTL